MHTKHKKQFNLESPQFAEDSDDDGRLISNQLIEMYNKEYSLMLSQTKNFFADCKDFITRFITYNNMGIGFNLPFILNTFMKVEAETTSPTKVGKQPATWQEKKRFFQGNFADIIKKMGEVIQELLNFEIKIKMTYLGEAFNTPTKVKTRTQLPTVRPRNASLSNFLTSNKKRNQNPEQQSKLRTILQKGMSPFNQTKMQVCDIKMSTAQNLQKLSSKIDNLKLTVQNNKNKEQKIWKIFNQKRPSRNMFCEESFDEDYGQFKKLNHMLSDMISVKNKNYYSSAYETVESSFR